VVICISSAACPSYLNTNLVVMLTGFDAILFFNLVMGISKDQVICMFFYVEYTKENVKKYRKRIEDFDVIMYSTC
jgi:hypothetical protein